MEERPFMKNGIVCNSTGVSFVIVHQYDRVPEWLDYYNDKYQVELKKDTVSREDFKLGDATSKLNEVKDTRMTLWSSVLKYSAQARDILIPERLCWPKHSDGIRDGRMENNMHQMMKKKKMQQERMRQ